MEKLIELLNEYEIEREEKIDLFNDKEKPLWEWYKDCAWYLTFEPTDNNKMNWESFSWDTAHSVIISKSYWFIQRLVKHDKIDFDKCWICYEINSTYDHYNLEERQDLWLIMLLSIQDSPIEFLVSILK